MSENNPVSKAKNPRRVTLQDIADVAGVQKMVVSNALSGKGRVAPATREKIRQLAREMNYIPNFAARALTTGRTGIIAVVSGPLNENYYGSIVDLLQKHLTADGFHLIVIRTPGEVKELTNATGILAVDGAVVIDNLGLVREFRSHPTIPCVSISTFQQSFVDNVIVDLSPGVEEALRLMLASDRQRIAYLVTARILTRESEVRARSYLKTMRDANRVPEIINVSTNDADILEARVMEYFQENGCPDALLCLNDEIAMCAFHVLKALGKKVPDDVLLVGCDGQRHMKYFNPPLSTIVQPATEMCELAWKFLKQRIANPNLPHQEAKLLGTLVVRESLINPTHLKM